MWTDILLGSVGAAAAGVVGAFAAESVHLALRGRRGGSSADVRRAKIAGARRRLVEDPR